MVVEKQRTNFLVKHFNLVVILLFILLSCVNYIPEMCYGKLVNAQDLTFHLQRLFEQVCGFKNGKIFPDISAFTFGQRMYGVNFFYPYVTVTPIAVLIYFFGNIQGTIFGLIGIRFFTLLISYWTMNRFSASRQKALIFSLIYSFSIHIMSEQFLRASIAGAIGMMFLPVAIYGIYQILFRDEREWIFAVLGVLGIIYTHVFTYLILITTVVATFIYLLIKKRELISKNRIFNWFKASLATFLLSMIVVVPFFEQMLSAHISFGKKTELESNNTFLSFLDGLVSIHLKNGSFGAFFTIVLILITYLLIKEKLFSKRLKIYLLLALFFIILSSSLFPWSIFQGTPLALIKFSWRWFMFVVIFSSLYIAEGIVCLTTKGKFNCLKLLPVGVVLNGLIISLFFSFSLLSGMDTSLGTLTNYDWSKRLNEPTFGDWEYATQQQKGIIGEDSVISPAQILVKKQIFVDGRKTKLKLKHDKYVFYVDGLSLTSRKVKLPMTWLKGMKANDDLGKNLPLVRDHDGYPIVENNGAKKIEITYDKTFLHKASIVVSCLSWVCLALGFLISLARKKFLFSKKV